MKTQHATIVHRVGDQVVRRDPQGRYCARDLGRILGYDSDGGNLSRNYVRGAGEWGSLFEEGRHWIKDHHGRVWLTGLGLLETLRLVVAVEREDRAEIADELLKRYARRERRTQSGVAPKGF